MAAQALKPGSIIGHRYRVERILGQGGLGKVYLARDLTNAGMPVAVKVLASRKPAQAELATLRQEFSLLSRLRHPNLVRIFDFGLIDGSHSPYLVEEYVDGQDLFQASGAWSPAQVARAVAVLCRVLQHIHSRGIVHRDVKPANILLPGGFEQVENLKVLDFGLAQWAEGSKDLGVGTLAYTAPEILLGQPATSRSDLYSLGVLLYQLLSRTLPFEDDDTGFLIQKQLQGRADLRPIEQLEHGPGLGQMIRGLLEKDPGNRPSSAEGVVRLLSSATGHDLLRGSSEGVESYFSAGRFVGREKETTLLRERAAQVRETGRGWTVFIAGESGAGKSRLMEEFRIGAVLEGWRVLEAGCQRNDSRPYGPFRELLARAERGSDSTGSAGKDPVFRFDDLPRVAEGVALEAADQAASGRFRDLVTREVVRRLEGKPTILMLHDFHWADEATVAVLDYLSSDIQSHPVLLCVSLRPGEVGAGPLGRLIEQSVRHLRGETLALEPLSEVSVEELVQSVVGESGDARGWIYRSSCGNPFFVEELLKHLVDRGLLQRGPAGWRLERDGLKSLEFPASIAVVLRHRVSCLSAEARELARWLAVFNRPAPRKLLHALVPLPHDSLAKALEESVSRQISRKAVLDGEECYEFRHALISEVIREDLPARHRRRMHRQIGEALAAQSGIQGNVQDLAFHFTEARAGEKAIRYALQAATACKAEFASEAALKYHEYVLTRKNNLTRGQICEIAMEAADCYCAVGLPRKAVNAIERQLRTNQKVLEPGMHARLLMQLSRSYQFLGDLKRTETEALRGLRFLKGDSRGSGSLSEDQAPIQAGLLRELAFCCLARSRPQKGLRLIGQALAGLVRHNGTQLSGILNSLKSSLCRVGCDLRGAVMSAKQSIQILEPTRAYHALPVAYSQLGLSLTALGRFRNALESHEDAVRTGERARSIILRTLALGNLAECYCRAGQLGNALGISQEATKLAGECANRLIEHGSRAILAETELCLGEYGAARANLKALSPNTDSSIAVYSRAHVSYLLAWLSVELGDCDAALECLQNLKALASPEAPVYEAELGEILRARVYLQGGEVRKATSLLERLNAAVTKKHWPYQMCIVRLWLAEALVLGGQLERARKCARDAVRLARAMPSRHLEAHGHLLLGKVIRLSNEPNKGADQRFAVASVEIETAIRMAEESEAAELIWRSHAEMAQVLELAGDTMAAANHAKKALEQLSLIESRVPREAVQQFRSVPERKEARTQCERVLAGDDLAEERQIHASVRVLEEQHLRTLYRASTVVNGIRDLDRLLETILDLLLEAVGVQRAFVFLRDEKSGRLRFAKGRNLERESIGQAERISRSILQDVDSQGRPFVSANARSDSRVSDRMSVLTHRLTTLLCAPLKVGGRVLGSVYGDHPAALGSLRESTINLFAAFCNLAAVAIDNALAHRHLVEERNDLEDRLRHVAGEGSREIVGRSGAIEDLLKRIALVAVSPLDVLITGESGTGKELVARVLHRTGRRAAGKFVALDCGSLSDTLVESELFGYRRGAFTGATENRPGLLEAADGGVIFLDEISNLSPKLQGKLLRVLQEREVRRLGETAARKVDVQVFAATNKDLKEELRRGRFRKDLYYRLNAMEVRVPPLRERMDDVPLLIDWFLAKTTETEGGLCKAFSPEARQLLTLYSYPGNVRQLKNIVQGAYYLAHGRIIEAENLPAEVRDWEQTADAGGDCEAAPLQIYRAIVQGKGTFEELVKKPFLKRRLGAPSVRQVIHLALTETGGRYRDALRLLKVPDHGYYVTMVFLKRHGCCLDFRRYRKGSTGLG